jgi:hypothetical protein
MISLGTGERNTYASFIINYVHVSDNAEEFNED